MYGRREVLRYLLSTTLGARLVPRVFGEVAAVRGKDASPFYRQAFAWSASLTGPEKELIRDYRSCRLNEDVDRLLRRAESALKSLRLGARAGSCEWGDVVSLDALNRGQLDPGNLNLARVVYLRSRRLIADGRGPEALDDLFDVVRLGRRVGSSGVFIAIICQCAFESTTVAGIARGLPELDPATRETIAPRREATPPTISWAEIMKREGRFIRSILRKKLEAIRGPIGTDSLTHAEVFSREEAGAVLALTGGDRERLLALIDEVVPRLAELAPVLDLPRHRYQTALEEYVARVRPINPIAVSVVDAAEGLKFARDRVTALWAMLDAAVTRLDRGDKAFLAITDPFGGRPFKVRPRGRGFDLESVLSFEQRQPVILSVGE